MKFFIIVAPLLLLFSLQPADSKISIIRVLQESEHPVPLGMVEDSVDDMYCGCGEQMSQKVKDKYFKKEVKGAFGKVWETAARCTKRNQENNQDKELTKDHLQAICVYTSGETGENFYKQFNTAVLTNRSEYGTTFKFHSLHFWLTSAIQILSSKNKCITSYRRSSTAFTGQLNQIIRFGSFASSSLSPTLTRFGSKTCFKVHTCHGAYLKQYPHLEDKEQEVLIPPYEMFQISEIPKNKFKYNLSDCKVVYVLNSTGVHSNLDCKAAK